VKDQIYVYIAGSYRGDTVVNVGKAAMFAAWLNAAGNGRIFCIVPHTMTAPVDYGMSCDGIDLGDKYWLKGTDWMRSKCDCIVMIGDWRQSYGSKGERSMAILEQQPTFYEEEYTDVKNEVVAYSSLAADIIAHFDQEDNAP